MIPQILHTGDRIGIVAPGKKVKPENIDAAIRIFRSWGLDVSLAKNLFSNNHAYLAGTDAERLEDLQSMIDDEAIKAIICARGGYGSTRIIDQLNLSKLHSSGKWIVGFSDITTIHLRLLKEDIVSIHGTMPIFFSPSEAASSVESLRKILFGEPVELMAPFKKNNRPGKGRGKLIGGNLSLIVDALGTMLDPNTEDTILVIEEIDEYLYKIDRMFMHLKRANKLQQLAGLVIGHMTDLTDTVPGFGETYSEIIMDKVSEYDFPVAFGFPIGHENPNLAWMHGSTATLTVNEKGSWLVSQ